MILRLLRRLRRRGDGQALVEFALVAPVLIFLLLGIVDFARAWNVYQVLTDAGREGARLAVVDNGSTVGDVQTIVTAAAGRAGITLDASDITVTEGAGRGDPTTVNIAHGHQLMFVGAFLGLVGGDRTLNFTIVSTMRRE